jgi:hypothetical protein
MSSAARPGLLAVECPANDPTLAHQTQTSYTSIMGNAKKPEKRGLGRPPGHKDGMVKPISARRRRLYQAGIAILATVVAVAMCFVAWKWSEAVSRVRCVSELTGKGVILWYGTNADEWSSDWPFHNVQRVKNFRLCDGQFSDDDVRRLRKAFPNASIYSVDTQNDSTDSSIGFLMGKPVKLPEDGDQTADHLPR